jgi:hypothetical protein
LTFDPQYKTTCCEIALSIPHTASRVIYKHFRNIEWQMKSMEDEEMEKREMEMMEARH